MDMRCTTNGNVDPKGKPRVYFTCHPDDFGKHFMRITSDLFAARDCAIYHTWNLAAPIPPEDMQSDIGSNHLVVVPVTHRLLTQPNRAMDVDIPYALHEHMPVLPIMMEPGLDPIYSRPNKFGELQYLSPLAQDETQISYSDKLRKHLESIFVNEAQIQQIRNAFDAYIFLSYRKKDRRCANELMRSIHSDPRYRDIAIWYDEFLTPGESFNESIENMLGSSKLVAILVTPNLLEEPDGKPNYVMSTEYPLAKALGTIIIPIEMEATTRAALDHKFPGIPDCLSWMNTSQFHEQFGNHLNTIAVTDNDNDPEHLYLIGLAYLMGIDVEVDRAKGLELIRAAAEQNHPYAMDRLFYMYRNGIGATLDYQEALIWAKRLAEFYEANYGREHPDTMIWLNNLSAAYGDANQHLESLRIQEEIYPLSAKIWGERDPKTLTALNNLSVAYIQMEQYEKALPLQEKACSILETAYGEQHPITLAALNNLGHLYGKLMSYSKAHSVLNKAYSLACKTLGPSDPNTITYLNNLAISQNNMGNKKESLSLHEKVYTLRCQVLGELHPDTMTSLANLAVVNHHNGNRKKALEQAKLAHSQRLQALGQDHPDTFHSMFNIASFYDDSGRRQKALGMYEKLYALQCSVIGSDCEDSLRTLDSLGSLYGNMGRRQEAVIAKEKLYHSYLKKWGGDHPDTLRALRNLSVAHFNNGSPAAALSHAEAYYKGLYRTIGATHPDTLQAKEDMEHLCTYI